MSSIQIVVISNVGIKRFDFILADNFSLKFYCDSVTEICTKVNSIYIYIYIYIYIFIK